MTWKVQIDLAMSTRHLQNINNYVLGTIETIRSRRQL